MNTCILLSLTVNDHINKDRIFVNHMLVTSVTDFALTFLADPPSDGVSSGITLVHASVCASSVD